MGEVREVFLLGAGFSRAVSKEMPLTKDLGEVIKNRLSDSKFFGQYIEAGEHLLESNFEEWLSSLAEDQPYRTPAENHAHRGLYAEVVNNLAAHMRERVTRSLRGARPDWLATLVEGWHERRATVITPNYDHLIESTVDSLQIPIASSQASSVLSRRLLPPGLVPFWTGMYDGNRIAPADSFKLLKLHGSLNWYWDPNTPSSMIDVGIDQAWSPDVAEVSSEDLRYRAPGMEPFLVPPLALKSSYFKQHILRDIWMRARGDVEITPSLICVGCSISPTDLALRGLLRAAKKASKVIVIDTDKTVPRRIAELLPDVEIDSSFCGGYDCVQRFTEWYSVEDRSTAQE